MKFRPIIRVLRQIYALRPQIVILNTYRLRIDREIDLLTSIDDCFYIRGLDINDATYLEQAYSGRSKGYYKRNGLPRLSDSRWLGLAVFDVNTDRIAYVAWIIQKTVSYLEDINLVLGDNQRFVKDGYCVPEYRHRGLHTRMEHERINRCVRDGAKEIFIQIAADNPKGIKSVTENGYEYYQTNKYLVITGLGVYREIKAFCRLKNLFGS